MRKQTIYYFLAVVVSQLLLIACSAPDDAKSGLVDSVAVTRAFLKSHSSPSAHSNNFIDSLMEAPEKSLDGKASYLLSMDATNSNKKLTKAVEPETARVFIKNYQTMLNHYDTNSWLISRGDIEKLLTNNTEVVHVFLGMVTPGDLKSLTLVMSPVKAGKHTPFLDLNPPKPSIIEYVTPCPTCMYSVRNPTNGTISTYNVEHEHDKIIFEKPIIYAGKGGVEE